jgi:hypothetical protein
MESFQAGIDKVIYNNDCNFLCSLDLKMIQLVACRRSDAHMRAFAWFEAYFDLHGDKMPNRAEIHLENQPKILLWQIYSRETEVLYDFDDVETLPYTTWNDLWMSCFPHCKVREYKQVTGKCWTCFWINDMRKRSSEKRVHVALKDLFMMHRGGFFMPERAW